MQMSEKPKTLFCYICGRQFGTSSLSIHIKSCAKKFDIEQSKKQPKDRIKIPDPPEELQNILNGNYNQEQLQAYNKKAINTHKYQVLPKCRFCSRTFNEESLKAHENGCSKKGNQKIEDKSGYNLQQEFKKPRTLTCCVCGRDFGLTSLKIHYPQCLQKFKNDEKKKPKEQRRSPPQFTEQQIQLINNKENWSLQQIQSFNNGATEGYREKGMTQCQNCGRKFLPESYLKHKKNCALINGQNKSVSASKPNNSASQSHFRASQSQFKKPRTLTCCVCGRDFGLTSLKIHYPQCSEKFLNDQKKKPKAERKQVPAFSQQQLDMINNKEDWTLQEIELFNKSANGHYREKAMVQCPNCGRKFLAQSYLKHKKNCVLINGNKSSNPTSGSTKNQSNFGSTASQFKKPRVLTCCVCGRQFGLTSLKIHYPQCIQKFENQEKKKPKSERRETPKFTEQQIDMINNKQNWTSQDIDIFNNKATDNYRDKGMVQCPNCGRKFLAESYLKHKKNCVLLNGQKKGKNSDSQPKLSSENQTNNSSQMKKPRVLMCHICGRQFGLTSLKIHHPKCQQKFLNQQKKKQKLERRPVPTFPEEQESTYNLDDAENWSIEKIQAYNKIANQIYRQQSLVSCSICGRKFFQQSLPKHLKFCQKNKEKQNQLANNSNGNPSKVSHSADMKSSSVGKQPALEKKGSIKSKKTEQKKLQQKNQSENYEQQQKIEIPKNEKKMVNNQSQMKQSQNNEKEENYQKHQQITQVDQSLQQTFKNQTKANPFKPFKQLQQVQSQHQQDNLSQNNEQKNQFISQDSKNQKDSKQLITKSLDTKQQLIQNKEVQNQKQIVKQPILSSSSLHPNFQDNQALKQSVKLSISKLIQKQKQEIAPINQKAKKEQKKPNLIKKPSIKELQQQESKQIKQIKNQILSPNQKIRSSKGFAAPRKKQENLQAEMKQCKICNRKFNSEKIQKHEQICFQSKERQRKSSKNIKQVSDSNEFLTKQANQSIMEGIKQSQKQESNQRDILSPQDKIRLKKGFASPRQKQLQAEMKMIQCHGCKRKFNQERIQKHESICKQVQQVNNKQAPTLGSYKNDLQAVQNQKVSIKRAPCPKCNRKFAEQRLQKHIQICKAVVPETKDQKIKTSNKNIPRTSINTKQESNYSIDDAKIQSEKETAQNIQLTTCQKCGRKFNSERIQKHQQVCKGKNNAQQLQSNSTSGGDFRKAKLQIPSKQYNLDKLEVKEETQLDDRVECPKCLRKFLSDRLQKHINICKAVPPLSIIEPKSKITKKEDTNINIQKLKPIEKTTTPISKTPSPNQQVLNSIGQDQYVETELQPCQKCSRKFVPERLQKHMQICKGNTKFKVGNEKKITNPSNLGVKKIHEQQIRKTKNEFFNMVKDIKEKKVKQQDIDRQIDEELYSIQATHKISRKQNLDRDNSSNKKKTKDFNISKSIVLPKI